MIRKGEVKEWPEGKEGGGKERHCQGGSEGRYCKGRRGREGKALCIT